MMFLLAAQSPRHARHADIEVTVEYQNDRGINIVTRLLYCVELCQKEEGIENSVVGSLDPLNYMNMGMTRTESLPLQV